mgnify:CR=1 FL=1
MFGTFLLRRFGWVLAAFVLLTVFFGWQGFGLRGDSSNEKMLPRDDPAFRYLEEFREIFGSDEFIVGALRLRAPADSAALERIETFAEKARRIPNVRMVQSPLRPSGGAEEKIDEEEARRTLLEDPAYSDVLASSDFRSFAIIVWIEHIDGDRAYGLYGVGVQIRPVRMRQIRQAPDLMQIPVMMRHIRDADQPGSFIRLPGEGLHRYSAFLILHNT